MVQGYEVKLNNGKPYAKSKTTSINELAVFTEPVLISYMKKDTKDNHYIRLVEITNIDSISAIDDTIRILKGGDVIGVAQLHNNTLYQPNRTVCITDNGNIYQMIVDKDKLTIFEISPEKNYISRLKGKVTEISDIKRDYVKDLNISVVTDKYFVWKAIEAHIYEENSAWTYNSTYNGNKNVTGNPAEVAQPHQLLTLNNGIDHYIQGIPYCWGGKDTPNYFQDKISRRTSPMYYAGNIDSKYSNGTYHDYISGTAGIDCSGFVCNCFSLPVLGTSDLMSSSYFNKIGDWKQGKQFDILLKSGHVMILNNYNIVNGQSVGCYVWESTTRDGVDAVLANYCDALYASQFNIYAYQYWQ